ncbi:MAG TPA: hypothetical protein PKH10_13110, partial [bacterium]|nr:hypothetical protein [bacterium]
MRLHKKDNVLLHYLLESHENAGLSSTLSREGDMLTIQFSTPLSAAPYLDRLVDHGVDLDHRIIGSV